MKVGDEIEFNGKKYRAESEAKSGSCIGCAFEDAPSCPIQEGCSTNSVILKDVKETPRHLELGVVKAEGDNVTFRIVEQTHRLNKFSQQGKVFRAFNGFSIGSSAYPAWGAAVSDMLWVRGDESDKDNTELHCSVAKFVIVCEAIAEYNASNGKGYEKPWPQTGDRYFFISGDITPGNLIFTDCAFDHNCQTCCNIFRTYEEAVAAADKVRMLLKELAAK